MEPARRDEPTGQEGIFAWYSYVQDFGGDFALDWLARLSSYGPRVWEPFCGSGTTLVASQFLGLDAVGYDVNPLMVGVARAKTDWTLDPDKLLSHVDDVIDRYARRGHAEPDAEVAGRWKDYERDTAGHNVDYPGDKKLERWIAPAVTEKFQTLFAAVDACGETPYAEFCRLAAASILIPCSNMAFRPNICYKPKPVLDAPVSREFRAKALRMVTDYVEAQRKGRSGSTVGVGDSRTAFPDETSDIVFTSPPYPNDMEYVHQTRLELGLLGFVSRRSDLTDLKKRMISSSVKLVYNDNAWQEALGLEVPGVRRVHDPIAETLVGRNWGWNAASMVAQYFGGMRAVMRNWHAHLRPGGIAAVVVGDSAFNGVKVETDVLTEEVAVLEGFAPVGIETFRARWNTKHGIELRESVVLLERSP